MPSMRKEVRKHPTDCEETLRVVLENVQHFNKNNAKLVQFDPQPGKDHVVLWYDPISPPAQSPGG